MSFHRGGAEDQQTCRLDGCRHVRELVLDGLELRDEPAELLALFRISQRGFVSALRRPTASAAMEMRPPSRIRRLSTKPSPGLPSNCDSGKAAIGEDDFARGAGAHAELIFLFADAKSRRSFSRMNADMPCCEACLSVTHMATQTSAYCAFVVNVLPPFKTHCPLSSVAVERVPAASDPASGSVNDQQPIHSPVASFGRYLLLLLFVTGDENVIRAERIVRGDNQRNSWDRRAPVLPQ